MKYLDVHEASAKWDMTERRITMLCRNGVIEGAQKDGKVWLIPANTPKPYDGRTKEAHRAGKKREKKERIVMGKYF